MREQMSNPFGGALGAMVSGASKLSIPNNSNLNNNLTNNFKKNNINHNKYQTNTKSQFYLPINTTKSSYLTPNNIILNKTTKFDHQTNKIQTMNQQCQFVSFKFSPNFNSTYDFSVLSSCLSLFDKNKNIQKQKNIKKADQQSKFSNKSKSIDTRIIHKTNPKLNSEKSSLNFYYTNATSLNNAKMSEVQSLIAS